MDKLIKIRGQEIPICKNSTKHKCFEDVLKHLKSTQKKTCLRACHTLEFKIGTYAPTITAEENGTNCNEFRFGYKFDVNLYVREERSEVLEKTVHTEYLVNTFMSLFGNVGGTLGIFVGFSIIGTTDWINESVTSRIQDFVGKMRKKSLHGSLKLGGENMEKIEDETFGEHPHC